MKPKIIFVNHASVLFSYGKINLITDPWLFGSAFNNSWDLISESKLDISEFKNITHIWFSHEHPDHFFPFVLNKIPENFRKKIQVYFQDTLDHRVAQKCKELGFQVIEMKHGKFYDLTDDFKIMCKPYMLYDSWLYLQIGDKKILNLNDCGVDSRTQASFIHKKIGDVDLLLTQFGYAAHIGDPDDVNLRKTASEEKLQRIKIQCEVFKPKYVIPFASFIRFSHIDNMYMNDQVNKIGDVENFIKNNTIAKPLILYPGDEWDLTSNHENMDAIQKYEKDFMTDFVPHKDSISLNLDQLAELSSGYIEKIKSRNSWFMIKLFHKLGFFKTAEIFLKDIEKCVSFDLINGLLLSETQKNNADIITDSDSLAFAFKFDYGADTLLANARFRRSGGRTMKFFRLFMIGTLNNNGRTFPFGIMGFLLREKSMWKSLFVEAILGNYEFK